MKTVVSKAQQIARDHHFAMHGKRKAKAKRGEGDGEGEIMVVALCKISRRL